MQTSDNIGAAALVDLVSDFYGASMDGRFWPTALAKLRDALDARLCALASHDFATATGGLQHAVGVDVSLIASYGDVYLESNPWLQREDPFRTPGAVLIGSEMVSEKLAHANDFARHWLGPQGLSHQLFAVLERQGAQISYLLVARLSDQKPFGDAEAALLRRLMPYLQRGLRAGAMLRRSQNVRQVALDTLDLMPIGVILVSLGGVPLATNRTARAVLSDREVFVVGRLGLEMIREGRRVRLRDLIAEALHAGPRNRAARTTAFSIARTSGGRPVSVLVSPVRSSGDTAGWEEPAAVVFVGDPEHAGEVDEIRLRQIYGLTGAEARVAALLANGYRLDEIAELLDVAYETIRKHLKQIFCKTGTGRQAELVRMVISGPGGLSL
ncbi:MAG: LuxR family transcriptional regulator [Rhodospirillales bacterium]|nr:MAG: LuxR family transcriptional regulator [Rhodospirillales bacterium]